MSVCYFCRKVGHTVRQCPTCPPCHSCGEKGHRSEKCRFVTKPIVVKSVVSKPIEFGPPLGRIEDWVDVEIIDYSSMKKQSWVEMDEDFLNATPLFH